MKNIKKVVALSALALALNFTSFTSSTSKADNMNLVTSTTSNGIYGCSFTFTNRDVLDKISEVKVNGKSYDKKAKKTDLKDSEGYSINEVDPQLFISKLNKGDKLEITTSDNKKISLNIDDPNRFMGLIFNKDSLKIDDLSDKKEDEKKEEKKEEHNKENKTASLIKSYTDGTSDAYIELSDNNLIGKIESIKVRGKVLDKASSKLAIFRKDAYAISDNKIYINRLANNDIVSIRVDGKDYNYSYNKKDNSLNLSDKTQRVYKVKLVGTFEPAVIGQKKYDGVSAATGTATNSKNSNVKILVSDKENPRDEDFKDLSEFRDLKVKNIILDEKSGMKGLYDPYNSAVTLNGNPKERGSYPISVELVDNTGNSIRTNSLDFKIYRTDEYLSDFMKDENFKKTQDGKFMWDMSPWVITRFNKDKEVVEVPKDLKAWFGSHESGKLGELGYPNKEKTQTLIIGKGRNLTIQNMKILSSVNIIVKDGGVLNVRDSSIFGKITVENGGRLSVNYDSYNKKFLNGASINGQIELKKGGILENSLIYSNTNFLTDSNKANKNVQPVVLVSGDSTISGEVYVRGDEAPTGTDPKTNRVYTGQNAFKVENSNLTIEKDASLGLFGAGRMATTSIGGDALILDNGKVQGEGKLIAIGGSGYSFEGGSAVSGVGEISNKEAYLKAGNTYSSDAKKTKAYDENKIKLSKQTVGYAKDSEYKEVQNDKDQPGYWLNSQKPPKLEEIPNYDKDKFVYNNVEIAREKAKEETEEKNPNLDENKPSDFDKKDPEKEDNKPIEKEKDKEESDKSEEKTKDEGLDKKIENLNIENKKLKEDLDNLNNKSESLKKEIEESNKIKDEAILEKEKYQKDLEEKEKLLSEANNKLAEANKIKDQALNDKEKSEEEKEKLKEDIKLLEEAKNRAEEDKNLALDNLKAENEAKLNEAIEKENIAKEKLAKVESEKEELSNKLKNLEEEKSKLENKKLEETKERTDIGVQTDSPKEKIESNTNSSLNDKTKNQNNKAIRKEIGNSNIELSSKENREKIESKEESKNYITKNTISEPTKNNKKITNSEEKPNLNVDNKVDKNELGESTSNDSKDKVVTHSDKRNLGNSQSSKNKTLDESNDKQAKLEKSSLNEARVYKKEPKKLTRNTNEKNTRTVNVRTGIRRSLPAILLLIVSSISLFISKKIK